MKKKTILILISMIIISFAGCGSDGGYVNKEMANDMSEMGLFDNSATASGSMDYSSTTINSKYADYSYDLTAKGNMDKKETALDFYEKVQDFVKSKSGYIENVKNTFRSNDVETLGYISDSAVKYAAQGSVQFTVQIKEEYAKDVIQLFDEFCKEQGLTVLVYNQYIYNYESKTVVDSTSSSNNKGTITKEELEKRLKYTDIDIIINYNIKRDVLGSMSLWLGQAVEELWESCGIILTIVFWMVAISFICLYVIVLPIIKLFRKSLYKHRKKHPEYYAPKKMIICQEAVAEDTKMVAESNTTEDAQTVAED